MSEHEQLMRAVVFDGGLGIKEVARPERGKDEVLIKVTMAGVCNTDHEIIRGYVPGFDGILGHEFIGTVEDADDKSLIGKRCTAEINCACGACDYCKNDLMRHCPNRTVLGIINRNGAFAEYITVPAQNLTLIPDQIPDHNAVFIEPLAAALEILDQVKIEPSSRVLLLGDGKLGLMIGHAVASTGCSLTVVGKHREKLDLLNYENVETVLLEHFENSIYDIVIEATGNSTAFQMAVSNVRPRGVIVLKSTYAGEVNINPSLAVVNEVTIIGSRCGLFERAVDFLLSRNVSFRELISARRPLTDAVKAFEASAAPGALKVILEV